MTSEISGLPPKLAQSARRATTLGRSLFNDALPDDYPYVNYEVGKKQLGTIVNDLAERYPMIVVAQTVEDQPLCAIEPLRTHSCSVEYFRSSG